MTAARAGSTAATVAGTAARPAATVGHAPRRTGRRGASALVALALAVPSSGTAATRTVELVVSARGIRPSAVEARRGEPLRLVVRAEAGEHCFALDALRIEKRLAPGRPVTIEVTPEEAGAFPFHCCTETGAAAERERGRLVVAE